MSNGRSMDGKASGATVAQALLGIAFSGPALNGKGQHNNVAVAIINAMLERLQLAIKGVPFYSLLSQVSPIDAALSVSQ